MAGLTSIIIWAIAQLPQLYLNWKLGRADALSSGLLVTWLLGDASNLFGCILTNQLPTQLWTAVYFLVAVC